MTRGLRWATATIAGLVAAVALGLTAAPAQAAGELELSTDGSTWSTSLGAALFASPQTLVPGDVVATELWVRNGSAVDARVELDVADELGVVPGTFEGDLSLTIAGTNAVGGTRWLGPVLAPGGTARIPLVVTFDVTSQVSSRLATSAVLDAALLVQAAGPTTAPPATQPGGSAAASQAPPRGGLAHTGQDVAGVLLVALVSVAVGFLLLGARRRSRRAED